MKKIFLPMALAAAVMLSASAKRQQASTASDPVVMEVNGKGIRQSEFRYLYEKNSRQQQEPQSLDEYVDMFVVYKLKVAEAEAAGIDTTAAFLKEFEGYCNDISKPYLVDTTETRRLLEESFSHMQTLRKVSHIMLPMGKTEQQTARFRARMDSIHTLLDNGADFADLARRYSSDLQSGANGGVLGYITANRLPYPFEQAAYATPVGQYSGVVEDAPYGFHIIRVEDEIPHPGRLRARHILKITEGLSPEEQAVKKAEIDSLYQLILQGKDFSLLARDNSDDRGSAQNGGLLGTFGPGVMVPEFEQQAYALTDGHTSEPFRSRFGWHIVQTIEHQPLGSLEDNRAIILKAMLRDQRAGMPEQAYVNAQALKFGIMLDTAGMASTKALMLSAPTSADAYRLIAGNNTPVVILPDGGSITAGAVAADIPESVRDINEDPWGEFERNAKAMMRQEILNRSRAELAQVNPEYNNLINEYRDGILLFEISNRSVWDRASKDSEALEAFFRAHRDRYTWDKPRFKGFVILATSDSIASEARGYLATNRIETDSLSSALNARFGKDIKVERVLTAQGDNAIIDEIAFNGPKASPVGRWVAWFPYLHKTITAPEEAADAKVAVSADLQQELEARWVEQLRARYKVKINRKAIEAMKREL